ncbi:MAG: virulence RhuM family protein [Deltaproteobacteria bacterium]|nr:virulence RhuM family protein [Deltaproteobacteria bacterium]
MTRGPRDSVPIPSDFLLYAAPDGAVKVRVLFKDDTAWLTQKALAELFGVGVPAINKHLKSIFESEELSRAATVSKMEIVGREGEREVTRGVEFYNLDAIIAVGYRVNSCQATQFRIWATKTLREFIIKGFVLDDAKVPLTQEFFAGVQNKLHWAITGQRAAELIYTSADATKLFMGLSTWKRRTRASEGSPP